MKHQKPYAKEQQHIEKEIKQADEIADKQEIQAEQVGKEDEVDTCTKIIAALEAEKQTLKDDLLRLAADMDNLRKRTAVDMEKTRKFAISEFALALLPVADSLERALAEIEKGEAEHTQNIQKVIDGIKLTQKELQNVFAKNNIVKQESLGKIFNPNMDKVVQEREDTSVPVGTVLEEWQSAYTLGDRILREAIVIVAKGQP